MYLSLNDIANDLLIMNIATVDRLWDKSPDAYTLYSFYYKTAKWQKTNQIKANDVYLKKCLKWGIDRISKAKKELKDLGLVTLVQSKKNGRIDGWYIKIEYMVTENKREDVKIETVKSSSLSDKEQVLNALESLNISKNKLTEILSEYLQTEQPPKEKKQKKLSKLEQFRSLILSDMGNRKMLSIGRDKVNSTADTKKHFKAISQLETFDMEQLANEYVEYVALNQMKASRLNKWLLAKLEDNVSAINHGVDEKNSSIQPTKQQQEMLNYMEFKLRPELPTACIAKIKYSIQEANAVIALAKKNQTWYKELFDAYIAHTIANQKHAKSFINYVNNFTGRYESV